MRSLSGSLSIRFFLTLLLLGLCAQPALQGIQAPLISDNAYISSEGLWVEYEWRAEAARVALRSGLSAIAADLFRALLDEDGLPDGLQSELSLDFIAALIAQGSYDEASLVLNDLPQNTDPDRQLLFAACVFYGSAANPDFEALEDKLSNLAAQNLGNHDLPWYYLLKGVMADAAGESKEAENFFQSAKSSAVSPMQSALFSSLVLRQQILTTPMDENLVVEVREKFEALAGQPAAFPFLREYVVLLHSAGRDAEAISALEKELEDVGANYSIDERASLLLLKGLILGVDSNAGWASLKELVRAGIESEATVIALQLLGSAQGRESDLLSLLNEILSRPEPHPFIAQLYYMGCQIALANPETTVIAEEYARYLLEQFPGFTDITSVYRLLAYAALQRNPPRYRVAADYLLGLRDQSTESADVAHLNRLIGDCYFLNRDYANAVDFYEAAISAPEVKADGTSVFLRLVISQIRSGQYEAALASVDRADFTGKLSDADRWQAEWSIALALQGNGQTEQALERLRLLVGRDTIAVPASLDLRLRWLEANISLQYGQDAEVAGKIDSLLERIDTMPENALGSEEGSRLKSELLLLKSKALIALEEVESAFDVLATIRVDFRNSIAAQRTYFAEASYHASVSDFVSAQQALEAFADDYPDSRLVPQALFQAALHCQTRGPEHYGEAVVLLDRLIQNYQGSELAYQANLKQGDLLRLMNKFEGAQRIYENLINSYPSHRLRYAAELSRADCIAALAQGSDNQFLEAVAILERLVDRPDLAVEVQIEAGYKWGNILQRNGDAAGALTVYSLVTSRYLLDGQNASALNSVGRYWLSRTILSLGDLLEDNGDAEEAGKLYRKLVAFNLPGRGIALSRINQLRLVESL